MQCSLHGRELFDGAPVYIGDWRRVVVEPVDCHHAALVLTSAEERRQFERRVGNPIAVMTRVQLSLGTVERQIEPCVSANAERDLGLAGLVYGTVAEEPCICLQSCTEFP